MGPNSYGELGDGTTIERDSPALIVLSPPAFTGVTNTPAGFQLIFAAVPGYNYTVQSTPVLGCLNCWSNLSIATATGSVATVTFTDTNHSSGAFYRLVRQPAP
jgi:hypothetical protein